jgi:hypothetical protein
MSRLLNCTVRPKLRNADCYYFVIWHLKYPEGAYGLVYLFIFKMFLGQVKLRSNKLSHNLTLR